ncbi:hypothetical protein BT93_L2650 [Corymbia citriodora subsp. variegata]|uniref:[histone H3]-lysine(27) N-trimethyltransferase n=1 Tax=Corymbia citriodora subsp. variegata TaxID=360336 RepID=A0A8T0CW04_CORYI|nr:hypothetical protein BT93_L2650 [Corymbia citriodora subsp. variegata]
MASKAASSPSASANRLDAPADQPALRPLETVPPVKDIANVIDAFKKQVAADRAVIIRKRIEENRRELAGVTEKIFTSSNQRNDHTCDNITSNSVDLLMKRQADALGMQNGIDANNGDRDSNNYLEDGHASTAVLLGSSIPVKNAVRPIKLPEVKRLPPYTTWIFLDRNQRMTEDQSVVGRRRIYYDQNGGEALICSDSEEEAIEDEEEKREFVDSEDFILRMTIKELGLSDQVLESLANCLSRSPSEIKARYEVLSKEEKDVGGSKNGDNEETSQTMSAFLDKDLDAALDSFDNLFCRRCLVFDCRLHGCSQDLVLPVDKQPPWSHTDEENVPCGPRCYKSALKLVKGATVSSPGSGDLEEKSNPSSNGSKSHVLTRKKSASSSDRMRLKQCQSESASSNAKNASESSDSETGPRQDASARVLSPRKTKSAGKGGLGKRNSKRVAERVLVCLRKRQKMMASDSDSIASGSLLSGDMKLRSKLQKENEDAASSSQKKLKSPGIGRPRRKDVTIEESHNLVQGEVPDAPSSEMTINPPSTDNNDTARKEEFVDENTCKQELSEDRSWKALEKGLYEKGLEIFGRNSCLIARNLLNGLKTCQEIFQYMNCSENKLICQGGDAANYPGEGYPKFDSNGNVVHIEPRRRSRFLRRRGRVRRLKYTWKSAAYHSIRKRITERKDQPCRQYNPCNCQTACSKQCSCLLNGTCCEKYCGCPKSCKNRFRGCHCAKNQCRSRQCPCFAADRECDPDVCRNCWVSCGDGTLGVPNQRGDNYECRNMKLLLKQQQRVLLGRSDVSGWGAFLKNSVSKHEYLGEYTGELISHREADKRGKIYDRENSSFLFNLNDQFVLDAYRKGDKLKFANHSPDPNCYAKVIMVAGDHRVGIFAKERINAGEELFYDYRYEPDRAPAWARKPEAAGSKKEEGAPSSGRAKKLA